MQFPLIFIKPWKDSPVASTAHPTVMFFIAVMLLATVKLELTLDAAKLESA